MHQDGWALPIPDAPFLQIPTTIQLAGLRPLQSYFSLSRCTPIDSRNVKKPGSIGRLTKFKGEPHTYIYLSPK